MSLAAEDPIVGELQEARGGDREAMGRLLESCRDYLRMVAEREIDADLAAKGAASGLVPETLLAACRHFETFRGRSRAELLAWLGRVLRNHRRDRATAGAFDRVGARTLVTRSDAPFEGIGIRP